MSELRTIIVDARTAQEAQEQARLWARAEPAIHLERITRVRPYTSPAPPPDTMPEGNEWRDKWSVEIAYSAAEPGLGL